MHTEHAPTDHVEQQPNYIPVIVVTVVLAILAILLLNSFKGNGYMWGHEANTAASHQGHNTGGTEAAAVVIANPTGLGALDTLTGNFVYNTGATQSITLPDGVKLSVGNNSSEAKLIAFLSDATMKVDTVNKSNGWISLDRLYFETGKSTLTPTSTTQLKNIAAILKAFPNVALKMGGYTDNTGSADGNLKLSDTRSKAAKTSLEALGVASDRIAAEGYGQEHPIADNATAEGRAQNRRIDVRVTKK